MKTTAEQIDQKLQLVKGEFTPSEASHIITNLLDQKINFHKIQQLQVWEGDHKCETESLETRIQELQQEKLIANEFIHTIQNLGKKLKINGVLEIEVIE